MRGQNSTLQNQNWWSLHTFGWLSCCKIFNRWILAFIRRHSLSIRSKTCSWNFGHFCLPPKGLGDTGVRSRVRSYWRVLVRYVDLSIFLAVSARFQVKVELLDRPLVPIPLYSRGDELVSPVRFPSQVSFPFPISFFWGSYSRQETIVGTCQFRAWSWCVL